MRNAIRKAVKQIIVVVYLSVIFAFSACAQQQRPNALIVNFEPSFGNQSTLILQRLPDGTFWNECTIYADEDKSKTKSREKTSTSEEKVSSIVAFLETYNFKVKGSTDTISSERVLWLGDSTTAYKTSYGGDGITVNGSFTRNGVSKKFAFWSPKKESENYRFVQLLFSMASNSFKKKKTLAHVKALQRYF